MNIAWLTWKDARHPEAGGAELVARELSRRLLADGHKVTMLTCGYQDAPARENMAGLEVIRIGNSRYAHTFQALAYFLRRMRGRYDVLIEEVNVAPYFSVLFERKARRYLLYHQLDGPVWDYETPRPLNIIGHYVLEPAASRLLSWTRTPVVTVSRSTAGDLARYGFAPERTHIISEGIEIEPLESLDNVAKYAQPTLLSLGAMRAMKRTLDQIEAFESVKASLPDARLKVAGSASGSYGRSVLARIGSSPYRDDIEYLGRVSVRDKIDLMRRAHVIMQTAVHEGWGLTVTEAASQGTPAVVYDVNGLRDSVRHDQTGIITPSSPSALASGIIQLLRDPNRYEAIRRAAWNWSQSITFDQSYLDFKRIIGAGA